MLFILFFGHCVGCPSVIVVCHVVHFVFGHCVGWKWTTWQTTATDRQSTQWPKNKMNNMTNNDHRRTAYTMTKKQNEQHDKQFFGHCVDCLSVAVVCHVVHFVFWSLCRLSFCDRCLSCCSFCFWSLCRLSFCDRCLSCNDHRRTAYTMTKKQNDKQRSTKHYIEN
jgi:hypothetical protein